MNSVPVGVTRWVDPALRDGDNALSICAVPAGACVLTERAADADSDDDTVAYNLVEGDSNEAERLLNLFPHAKYANQLVPGVCDAPTPVPAL